MTSGGEMARREVDVRAGVTLSVQTFGEPGDPAVLLVPGRGAGGREWGDGLCERVAGGLRYVVRYDGRTADDRTLAGDVAAVLEVLEIGSAHLAARGEVAARVARLANELHPDRVESTTVVHDDDDDDDAAAVTILRATSGGWQRQADRLANRFSGHDPAGWFDALYAAASAGEVDMPWDRDEANPILVDWAREHRVEGSGRRALVVGSGLGRDSEFVATLGFATTAFDISPAAIANVRRRFPASPVEYRVANLLAPPPDLARSFDLVVEIYTVQAMSRTVRNRATANVGSFVAPGGTLLVVQVHADAVDDHGPPWLLTRDEIEAFATGGLRTVRVEVVDDPSRPHWRAEFVRTG
jgi:SAM-dependent methyltransferase